MITSTVSGTPDTPAANPTAAAVPAVVDNSAEIAALKAEIAEGKRTTEFWYGKASQQPAPAAAPEPVEEVEEVDMLDLLSTQGAKGFDKFMKARGYMSKAEVDSVVNTKANQLSAEADLVAAYPDLRKPDSDFFRATAAAYGDLKRQGVPEALAMKLAAQQAELGGFKAGKIKTAATVADDAKALKEANRLARIKAQAGDTSSRTVETEEEDDDELNAQELHICEAMGITPEAYKARASKGVQMGMRQMPATRKKA